MGFCFAPNMLDGVVVRAVGWQPQEGDVCKPVSFTEVLFQFPGFVPSGVVPHDRDLLAGMFVDELGEGIDDGVTVLPVQRCEFHTPVSLVEEPDVGLAAALPVHFQHGGYPSAAPGSSGECFVFDAHLVSCEHEMPLRTCVIDQVADLFHTGCHDLLGGAALVPGGGLLERQSSMVEQHLVGGVRREDDLELGGNVVL